MFIDLDKEYKELNPKYSSKFTITENLPDEAKDYVDAILESENKYIFCIENYFNYLEATKVTTDDVVEVNGKMFLRKRYFIRRNHFFRSKKPVKAKGKLLGYYINGEVYSKDSIFYPELCIKLVYRDILRKNPMFSQLLEDVEKAKREKQIISIGGEYRSIKILSIVLDLK